MDCQEGTGKINYRIHTDAIKSNLIPPELTSQQTNELICISNMENINAVLIEDGLSQ